MAKSVTTYTCSSCGHEASGWLGQCPNCGAWGSFEEAEIKLGGNSKGNADLDVVDLSKVEISNKGRLSTGVSEFDRVLGGGLVEGAVVLISGEPGIGKSTLLMQVVHSFVSSSVEAVYVSAEESIQQIALRSHRLFGKSSSKVKAIAAFEVNSIIDKLDELKPQVVVIDSVQTIFDDQARGLPGGVSQIKHVASKLVSYAKKNGISIILVGQITKDGVVAGPKLLEHLVDVVMHLEGDEKRGLRMLRSMKNRFGTINEVGLFEMNEKGMDEIPDPSKYFVSSAIKHSVGVCKTAVMEGNRVLIFEVQALIVSSPYSLPKRISQGIPKSRIELVAAILTKYTNLDLSSRDIYINVAGGFNVKDPSVDVAIILAIYSSLKKSKLPANLVAAGEVYLSGGIHSPVRIRSILTEIKRLGFSSLQTDHRAFDHISKISKVFPLK